MLVRTIDFDRQYKRVSPSLERIIHSLTSEKLRITSRLQHSAFSTGNTIFLKNIILLILISYYIRLKLKIIIVSNPTIQALLFNINKHLLRVWKMHLFMIQYYKRVTILVFTKFLYQACFLYWYWFLLITRHIFCFYGFLYTDDCYTSEKSFFKRPSKSS